MKKTIVTALIAAMVLASPGLFTSTVHAETKDFDFVPIKNARTLDSHGASKAGGSSYENCAYITPTYFSQVGNVDFWVQGNGVMTNIVNISSGGVNVTRHRYYTTSAPAGGTYYVGGRVTSAVNGNSIHVKGRFTP